MILQGFVKINLTPVGQIARVKTSARHAGLANAVFGFFIQVGETFVVEKSQPGINVPDRQVAEISQTLTPGRVIAECESDLFRLVEIIFVPRNQVGEGKIAQRISKRAKPKLL